MKTKIFAASVIACVLLMNHHLHAQSSSANNNPGGGKFLGYDAGQNLEFRTNNTTRMQMMQNGNSTINGFNVNRSGFVGLSQDPTFFTGGVATPFSLLHLNGDNSPGGPQQSGYRTWMRYGITFTHNRDLMYVGPRRIEASDETTDMVIAWSDNPGGPEVGPDNLTFIFTSGNGLGAGAASDGGLEVARMTPLARTGIGNGFNNTLDPKRTLHTYHPSNPQFRIAQSLSSDINLGNKADFQVSNLGNLHIRPSVDTLRRTVAIGFLAGEESNPINFGPIRTALDVGGLTRVRSLPDDSIPNCIITGYMPGTDSADHFLTRLDFLLDDTTGCYFLNAIGEWVDICNINGNDCRWEDIPSGTVINQTDIYTGVVTNNDCERGKVSIGTLQSKAKLTVEMSTNLDNSTWGIASNVNDDLPGFGGPAGDIITGIEGISSGINQPNTYVGVYGQAGVPFFGGGGKYAVGVRALAMNDEGSTIGVHAVAQNSISENIGIYAEAPSGPSNYAILINGATASATAPIILSDQALKQEITNLENAGEILQQLSPKNYFYINTDDHVVNTSTGLQYGFLAQEVQTILPEIVHTVKIPARIDSAGFVDGTEEEYLGIQYSQLIAILVAAVNDQSSTVAEQASLLGSQTEEMASMQAQLDTQADQITAMQESLATALAAMELAKSNMDNCCQNKATGSASPASGSPQLQQNVPNPFEGSTRIDFSLPETAQVRLEISDSQGRSLETLINGQLAAGSHSSTWDGSRYSPGMYYYSLYANGELLSKKMIKRQWE